MLGQKLALLNSLLVETEKQKSLIEANDLDGLEPSLAARQALMDAIDDLDRQIAAFPPEAGQGLVREIRTALERLMKLDRDNRLNAAAMAESLKADSREVAVLRSMKAYAAPVDRGSKFIDKEG